MFPQFRTKKLGKSDIRVCNGDDGTINHIIKNSYKWNGIKSYFSANLLGMDISLLSTVGMNLLIKNYFDKYF